MPGRIAVAIIGCGGISRRHTQQFLEREDCRIAALCDVSQAAMEARRETIEKARPGEAPLLIADYKELLARPDIDAVAVLLPHALHFPVCKAALEAGKHVLVEKPMTTDSGEARQLLEASKKNGRLLAIAYQRSYMPEYLYLRQAVARGDLGPLRFMTAHVEQGWLAGARKSKEAGKAAWRLDPSLSGGGQLVDTGSHTLAALLYICGMDPVEVFAFVDNCGFDVDVDTAMVARFAQGAQAAITVGGFGHSVTESIRFVGEKGSGRVFFRTVAEQSLEIDGAAIDAKAAIPASNPQANLLDAIQGKAQIGADGLLGLRVALLSEAAYRASREGRAVKVQRYEG